MKSMRHLLQLFTRREKCQIAGLAVLILVGSLFEVLGIGCVIPLIKIVSNPAFLRTNAYAQSVLSRLGLESDRAIILAVGSAFAAVFCLKNLYLALQWRVVYGFIWKKSVIFSKRLLQSYLSRPYTFHLQKNTAELVRNITIEVVQVFKGVLWPFMVVLTEVLVAVGLLILLAMVHIWVAIAAFVCLGCLGVFLTILFRRRLSRFGELRAEQQTRMIQSVTQSLGGVKEIKMLQREEYFVETFAQTGKSFAQALLEHALILQYPKMIIETVVIIGFAGVIVGSVLSGNDMRAIVPLLLVLGMATVRMMPSVDRIVKSLNKARFYEPSIAVVRKEFKEAARKRGVEGSFQSEPLRPFSEKIIMRDLVYHYPAGETAAIDHITLEIVQGQSVGLAGSSGAGKTTLVNLMLGLLSPSSGEILVDGVSIATDIGGWQKQIGYIPQDSYLADDTIRRNVAFGVYDQDITDSAVWEALRLAQLDVFVKGLPQGLDTVVGERGVRISGGQRQRIGIARALYYQPRMLVFDEATASLDYETERQLTAAIQGLAGERTVIIVTHRLQTVRSCSRIHLLDNGRLLEEGTFDELACGNGMFKTLLKASGNK